MLGFRDIVDLVFRGVGKGNGKRYYSVEIICPQGLVKCDNRQVKGVN